MTDRNWEGKREQMWDRIVCTCFHKENDAYAIFSKKCVFRAERPGLCFNQAWNDQFLIKVLCLKYHLVLWSAVDVFWGFVDVLLVLSLVVVELRSRKCNTSFTYLKLKACQKRKGLSCWKTFNVRSRTMKLSLIGCCQRPLGPKKWSPHGYAVRQSP